MSPTVTYCILLYCFILFYFTYIILYITLHYIILYSNIDLWAIFLLPDAVLGWAKMQKWRKCCAIVFLWMHFKTHYGSLCLFCTVPICVSCWFNLYKGFKPTVLPQNVKALFHLYSVFTICYTFIHQLFGQYWNMSVQSGCVAQLCFYALCFIMCSSLLVQSSVTAAI